MEALLEINWIPSYAATIIAFLLGIGLAAIGFQIIRLDVTGASGGLLNWGSLESVLVTPQTLYYYTENSGTYLDIYSTGWEF